MICKICHKEIVTDKEVVGFLHTTKGDLRCHLSCINLFYECGFKSIDYEKGLVI